MALLITWLQFFSLAMVIGIAGYNLSVRADKIAEKTGLGKNLVGIILLATVTSLPELMTGISSVTVTDNPDLAIGNVFGSCLFNLFLVFFLDFFYQKKSVFSEVTQGQIITATFVIFMLSVTGFSLAISPEAEIPSFWHVGLSSLVIPFVYVIAMKFTYEFETKNRKETTLFNDTKASIKKDILIFSVCAVLIIACGMILPFVGEKIMTQMNWQSAFVGTIFMAFATVLPEIAVTISSLRIGAIDMAFSNLLGSNLFNILILSVVDMFYTKGTLFKHADRGHLVTVFSVLMMMGVIILGFVQPPQKKFMKSVSFLSLVILLLFIINAWVIFER